MFNLSNTRMGAIKTMGMVAEEDSESPAQFVYTSILLDYNARIRLEAVGTSNLTFPNDDW